MNRYKRLKKASLVLAVSLLAGALIGKTVFYIQKLSRSHSNLIAAAPTSPTRSDTTSSLPIAEKPNLADLVPIHLPDKATVEQELAVKDRHDFFEDIIALEDLNEELHYENEELRVQLNDFLNWLLVNYKGRYPLPEHLLARLQINPISDGALLNPELAEYLRMSIDEEEHINNSFLDIKTTLAQIEAAIISVQAQDEDRVVLQVPKFEEEGEILREDLYDDLATTLGDDRFFQFLDVAETALNSNMYYFGAAERTMVFEVVYLAGQDRPQLMIKDGWLMEDGENRRTIHLTESFVSEVPDEYLQYLNFMPASVSAIYQ